MHARLALIGGEEFADGFEEVHASLLKDTGRAQPRVIFLPTCAADDGNDAIDYWCTTAREKFSALGALIETPRVIDRASANNPHYAQLIAEADVIYFGGGYPHVAMNILPDTRVMMALQTALERGVLIAGSSGGAMLLGARSEVMTPELAGEIGRVWKHGSPPDWDPPLPPIIDCLGWVKHGWDPPLPPIIDCLGWVKHGFCAPHFNRVFSWKWLERGILAEDEVMIGIDEQTALVLRQADHWQVRGRGAVTLVRSDLQPRRNVAGDSVTL
jgi:cyanophycinase-like exopeptidase